jgi:AcrR family transcriptional regulator
VTETKRLAPEQRKQEILGAAVEMALTVGYDRLIRDDLAKAAGCSAGLIPCYFGDMVALRKAVLVEAVRREVVPIVAQGLVRGELVARQAPKELREAAARHLVG